MKSRATLFLIEMLIAVLVFSFSAAIATGIFVQANKMSDEASYSAAAVSGAGSAAERFKSGVKDISSTFESEGRSFSIYFEGETSGNLESGEIRVADADGAVIYSLPVARIREVSQ